MHFMTCFELLTEVASDLVETSGKAPAATTPSPADLGPYYHAGDFDETMQAWAEEEFRHMKAELC